VVPSVMDPPATEIEAPTGEAMVLTATTALADMVTALGGMFTVAMAITAGDITDTAMAITAGDITGTAMAIGAGAIQGTDSASALGSVTFPIHTDIRTAILRIRIAPRRIRITRHIRTARMDTRIRPILRSNIINTRIRRRPVRKMSIRRLRRTVI